MRSRHSLPALHWRRRSVAGYTAELGAARISEEIDALEVMAVPPMVYMVATRIWAALITMIPLYLAALFSSYLATQAIVTKFFELSSGTYTHYFQLFLPATDIFYSVIKAVIFAVVVTLIHCYYGYNASGGPAGVGIATGKAIRMSIVVVVVLNLFLSLLMWGGGDTISDRGMSRRLFTIFVGTLVTVLLGVGVWFWCVRPTALSTTPTTSPSTSTEPDSR